MVDVPRPPGNRLAAGAELDALVPQDFQDGLAEVGLLSHLLEQGPDLPLVDLNPLELLALGLLAAVQLVDHPLDLFFQARKHTVDFTAQPLKACDLCFDLAFVTRRHRFLST